MECTETIAPALISREQESRLYKYLQEELEGQYLRYELISKKVGRTADGTATAWEQGIALDWLNAMLERDAEVAVKRKVEVNHRVPFAEIRSGVVSNPNYQAFLDTLEQDALDSITNNGPYMEWISQIRRLKPTDIPFSEAYVRQYADMNLSSRVRAMKGTCLQLQGSAGALMLPVGENGHSE